MDWVAFSLRFATLRLNLWQRGLQHFERRLQTAFNQISDLGCCFQLRVETS